MKILIVDDKKENLYLLETLLKGSGYQVVSASNGKEALEKLHSEGFDMIISDILMPVMDGFQLCKEVKGDKKLSKIPFVFYTATYTDKNDEEFALSLGVEKYIIKPTEPDELLKILESIIKEHREGALISQKPKSLPGEEEEHYKLYSERLVNKLEKKMLDLEKSERKYHRLCENVNDLVFSLDEEGRFTAANCKTELFGYTPGDVIGKHFTEILTPKGLEIAGHYFEQAKKDVSARHTYEFEIAKKDGSIAIAGISISSIYEEGKFIGRYGIARDITERKQAEEALKESQCYTRSLIETNLDALVTISDEGKITDVNQATELITGMSRTKIIGTDFSKYFTNPDTARKGYQQVFRDDHVLNYPLEIKHRDGKITPVLYNASVYKDEEGNVTGVIASARDITERKQAEDEARKMHQSLVKAHRKLQGAYEGEKQLRDKLIQSEKLASLGQMGAKIAHEINNPLTVISGRAQLYLMEDLDERLKKTFELIIRETKRIENITFAYRNLSRPVLPKQELLDLNEVLEESVENLINTGEIKHYKIQRNFYPDLPQVLGDSNRLVQVFRNLIVNASHAMADNKEKVLTLRSSVSKNGKFAEISIQDTGSGIEKEKLAKIFEVYYTTKADGLGTGLGLVVVKDIVEKQHKGKVLVESEPGKGTTFTVQLPLKVEKKQKKILVADDEAYIRELYTQFFEYKGLEVFTAVNGKEALDNYAKIQPDIVLSDIEMPVMNGFELAEKIREREPEQKIIFVTGFYFEHSVTERLKKTNIPYFTKPVDLNELWKKVSEELKISS